MQRRIPHNPPRPDVPARQLKLRLDQTHNLTTHPQHFHHRRQHQSQRNERHIEHRQIRCLRHIRRIQVPHVVLLPRHHPRITPNPPRQLVRPHIKRIHLRRPVLQQAIRKPPRTRSHIHRHHPRRINPEMPQRSLQLQPAPTHIPRLLQHLQKIIRAYRLPRLRRRHAIHPYFPSQHQPSPLLTRIHQPAGRKLCI